MHPFCQAIFVSIFQASYLPMHQTLFYQVTHLPIYATVYLPIYNVSSIYYAYYVSTPLLIYQPSILLFIHMSNHSLCIHPFSFVLIYLSTYSSIYH